MLQPIQVDFGRGIASAMGNATESVKNIGDIARNYLATEERKKTRAEDVAYRDQQAATAKEQFEKNYLLNQAQDTRAQAQEGRAANEAKILSNTRQALPVANQEVQAIMQDVVTPRQSDAILAAYNKNPKADVQGMVNKAQAQYNANPVLQKQMLQSMALSTGADESVDAQGNKIFTNREVDPTQMIAQRDKLLTGLDQQIAAGKLMDWDKTKFNAEMGLKNKELGLRAAALKATGDKFHPYTATVGFDANNQPTSDTSKIQYKTQIQVTSPKMDDFVMRKYGDKNVIPGSLSDFVPTASAAKGSNGVDKSTLELIRQAGGGKLLGGTSGAQLVSDVDTWRAAYPKAPPNVVANKLLQLSTDNMIFDDPDADKMHAFLKTYK